MIRDSLGDMGLPECLTGQKHNKLKLGFGSVIGSIVEKEMLGRPTKILLST